MATLERFLLPQGQRLTVLSVDERFLALALFELAFAACAGLAVAAGSCFQRYSPIVRCTLVLVPMFVGALFATALKVAQLKQALSATGIIGVSAMTTQKQLALYTIPLAAFAAGLFAVGVAYLIREV